MLDAVEPALPGQHVAHAHETHCIVGFGEILLQRGHACAGDQDRRSQRPADQPRDPSAFPALEVHARPPVHQTGWTLAKRA